MPQNCQALKSKQGLHTHKSETETHYTVCENSEVIIHV